MEQYYIKVGNRYRKVHGAPRFPADGLWGVLRDQQSMYQLLPISAWKETTPEIMATIGQKVSRLAGMLADSPNFTPHTVSAYEFAQNIIELLARNDPPEPKW